MKSARSLAVLMLLSGASSAALAAESDLVTVRTGLVEALRTQQGANPAGSKLLTSPYQYQQLLDGLLSRVWESDHTNAILGLINDFHLRPKVFQVDGAGSDATLGFEYSYAKSIAGRVINPQSRDPLGLSLQARASGNVAASASKNPDSFLDTAISFSLFQAIGGVEPMMYSSNAAAASARAATAATEIQTTGSERENDPRWIEATKGWDQHVLPQFLWTLSANGSLEADQEFENRQWTYGGMLGLSLRDWRDEHWVSWLNLPDYPFALVRFLTGEDRFQPSGHSFPTLHAGVDMVDPADNATRLAVDPDQEAFTRLRGEVTFKTPLGALLSHDIWVSASYRLYHEPDASAAIRAADLDTFEYFVAKLEFLGGFSLSYSTGRLPLDLESDRVFALGYEIHF